MYVTVEVKLEYTLVVYRVGTGLIYFVNKWGKF